MEELLLEIQNLPEYKQLQDNGGVIGAFGMPLSLVQLVLPLLHEDGSQILFIAPNDFTALNMHSSIENSVYIPTREMLLRPATLGRENLAQRLSALEHIREAKVICMSISAVRQPLCPPGIFFDSFINLKATSTAEPKQIIDRLIRMGFERLEKVEETGQCSLRGDILDIGSADGFYRIEFFGDEIEKITAFSPETQRSSSEKKEEIFVAPLSEFILSKRAGQEAEKFLISEQKRVGNKFGYELISSKIAEYLRFIEDKRSFDDLRNLVHVIYPDTTIFDYIKNPVCVLLGSGQLEKSAETFDEEFHLSIQNALNAKYYLTGEENLVIPTDKIFERCSRYKLIDINQFEKSKNFKYGTQINFDAKKLSGYSSKIDELSKDIKIRVESGHRVFLMCGSQSRAQTLKELFAKDDLFNITVLPDKLNEGFVKDKLIVYGETNIYGQSRKTHKTGLKKQTEDFWQNIKVGDIIVHDLYGKGIYMGLQTRTAAGRTRDYIMLEYLGGDKLYLPIDQAGRIQKYLSGSDAIPKLNKLGGKDWESSKAKARGALKDLAGTLFKLYQARINAKGHMFSSDTVWQKEFEDAFEFEETPGQSQVIAEIKADMENGKAMDRLLLGDVGYGKTEVAMRACFKAVNDQKQCLILTPTTLLCSQHFQTFTQRFEGFGANIGRLSRFSSSSEVKKTLKDLKEGNIDILVSTHRALSKDVEFKDLGLLVVDEEHRFGVAHKEKIKEIKTNVDVLSLSATPIPRTLEMSLIGIRNLSTIDTPIEERIPINTYVLEYSDDLVKEAIFRETARGGQVFFVCRKISTLNRIAAQVSEELPEVKIRVAHGQMEKHELERTMQEFLDCKFDVLFSTTIVESGLDIKNANTIIIYEADKFGLSELYQLKGRVGRSSVQSYAYLTFISESMLTIDAIKRLNTLRDFTEFGSGLKVAMRDLEIRGAGNLLGAEQSGHMLSVGYEMYLRLMQEAVSELKGETKPQETETSIELNIDAHLNKNYVEDEDTRIEIYKKIAAIKTKKDAKEVQNELIERFGPIPKATKNLITIALLKSYAQGRGIESIIRKSEIIEIIFALGACVNVEKLLNALNDYPEIRLIPKQPFTIHIRNKKYTIIDIFKIIGEIDCN